MLPVLTSDLEVPDDGHLGPTQGGYHDEMAVVSGNDARDDATRGRSAGRRRVGQVAEEREPCDGRCGRPAAGMLLLSEAAPDRDREARLQGEHGRVRLQGRVRTAEGWSGSLGMHLDERRLSAMTVRKIGRASCRER